MGLPADLVCFSHLRYDFVFQRPNHLMSRCARERRVFFVEEPLYEQGSAGVEMIPVRDGLVRIVPRLPRPASRNDEELRLASLIARALKERVVSKPIVWFYTPMALPLASHFAPSLVVYDCMDELSSFLGASPRLLDRERALFNAADVVFTGGQSLYEAKRSRHHAVHAFPSSVDAEHFGHARDGGEEPADQRSISGPKIGFFGVIDERMDLELVARIADERPSYQFVMLGPVVKIDPSSLPERPNIHWLGHKAYTELSAYIAGWDVAFMPFALNQATRFISPTKTLEYLAAGMPIVSTPIRDVVTPYGEAGAVHIATEEGFAEALDRALATDRVEHRRMCDRFVAATSWDATWKAMCNLMEQAMVASSISGTIKKAAGSTWSTF